MTNPLPPTPSKPPAEDTARYVAWLQSAGKTVQGAAREEVSLRVGDWGFFQHGPGPGAPLDRVALDKAGNAVTSQGGAWGALLAAPGLDAAGALKRAAWLYRAAELDGARATAKGIPGAADAALEKRADGTVVLTGLLVFPPNMSDGMRLTVTAPASGAATVAIEASK